MPLLQTDCICPGCFKEFEQVCIAADRELKIGIRQPRTSSLGRVDTEHSCNRPLGSIVRYPSRGRQHIDDSISIRQSLMIRVGGTKRCGLSLAPFDHPRPVDLAAHGIKIAFNLDDDRCGFSCHNAVNLAAISTNHDISKYDCGNASLFEVVLQPP